MEIQPAVANLVTEDYSLRLAHISTAAITMPLLLQSSMSDPILYA